MEERHLMIEANKANRLYIKDLWSYRELFFVLAWRDIIVRYKQTVIGILWSVIRPLLTMIVFTIIFGKIAKLPSDIGVPYILMVFAGMLPWQFISNTILTGSESLLENQGLISKVYFPRIILPSVRIITSLVEFMISSVLLVFFFLWYCYLPSWQIVFLPYFMLLAIGVSLGVTFIISSLNVKYRDFRCIIPFLVQFGMYISPIGFSSTVIPENWRVLYAMNPVVGIVDGIRWCLFGSHLMPEAVIFSTAWAILLFIGGFFWFRKMETDFADFI